MRMKHAPSLSRAQKSEKERYPPVSDSADQSVTPAGNLMVMHVKRKNGLYAKALGKCIGKLGRFFASCPSRAHGMHIHAWRTQ